MRDRKCQRVSGFQLITMTFIMAKEKEGFRPPFPLCGLRYFSSSIMPQRDWSPNADHARRTALTVKSRPIRSVHPYGEDRPRRNHTIRRWKGNCDSVGYQPGDWLNLACSSLIDCDFQKHFLFHCCVCLICGSSIVQARMRQRKPLWAQG